MLAIIVTIVPINSNVVTHGKVYPIQHHVIKFVSDLLHVGCWWFSPGTPVSSNNKTDHHDITEILMKVTLNMTTLTLNSMQKKIIIQGT
jgi:hypothetical protein